MLDKYKVRISNEMYNELKYKLLSDNIKYENKLNKNQFYCKILKYFCVSYNKMLPIIKQKLQNYISNKNTRLYVSNQINYAFYNEKYSDYNTETLNREIFFYVSKENFDLFATIEKDFLTEETTFSDFVRTAFNYFLSLNDNTQNLILCSDELFIIQKAIDNQNILEVNGEYIIPLFCKPDARESIYYLTGLKINKDKSKAYYNIKINDINTIITTEYEYDKRKIKNEDINNLAILALFPDDLEKQISVNFKLTNKGVDILLKNKDSYDLYYTQSDDNPYGDFMPEIQADGYTIEHEVEDSEEFLLHYFKSFGKEVKIISPESFKEKLKEYYKEALKALE